MTRLLNHHHIWNLIYNAQSSRCHDPTSPNTAPVTQKDSLTQSLLHMKPHLQCAEQQVSRSNLTKYCPCHAERLTYLIIITYETSFTMRGATGVTIQPHKYCACHAERLAYLVLITYETSFTMRGATGVTIQPHQILRLSRRKTHILSPHHIWNVIYSARSNRCHDPTSPNTAPATQNDHPTSGWNLRRTAETSFPMRDRSDHNPTIKTQTATRRSSEVTFRAAQEHFLL